MMMISGGCRRVAGFILHSADVAQLAQQMYERLMSREDIAVMNQPGNMEDAYQGLERSLYPENTPAPDNPKYNPGLYRSIDALLRIIVKQFPELYKFMPWLVTQHKRQEELVAYTGIGHILDILRQAFQQMEYLRAQPPGSPNAAPVPDINQMTFEDLEQWVYQRNSLGIQIGEGIEWDEDPNDTGVYDLGNGYKVWPVLTEHDLKQEGELMGHCVGGYCSIVASGDTSIWSLRDQKGEPHVTIEMNPKSHSIIQIQGRSNQEPNDEYKVMVAQWFQQLKQEGVDVSWVIEINYVDDLTSWEAENAKNQAGDYGVPVSVSISYRDIAREMVENVEHYGWGPDSETIQTLLEVADLGGERQKAESAMRDAAERKIEELAQEKEEEWQNDRDNLRDDFTQWLEDQKDEQEEGEYEDTNSDFDYWLDAMGHEEYAEGNRPDFESDVESEYDGLYDMRMAKISTWTERKGINIGEEQEEGDMEPIQDPFSVPEEVPTPAPAPEREREKVPAGEFVPPRVPCAIEIGKEQEEGDMIPLEDPFAPKEEPTPTPERTPEREREKVPVSSHWKLAMQPGYEEGDAPEESDHPAYMGFHQAYKILFVRPDGENEVTLVSPSYPTDWPAGQALVANSLPGKGGLHGINAVWEDHRDLLESYKSSPWVEVKLNLWGHFSRGTDGIRAEKAYPLEIYVPDGLTWFGKYSSDEIAFMLLDKYGKGVSWQIQTKLTHAAMGQWPNLPNGWTLNADYVPDYESDKVVLAFPDGVTIKEIESKHDLAVEKNNNPHFDPEISSYGAKTLTYSVRDPQNKVMASFQVRQASVRHAKGTLLSAIAVDGQEAHNSPAGTYIGKFMQQNWASVEQEQLSEGWSVKPQSTGADHYGPAEVNYSFYDNRGAHRATVTVKDADNVLSVEKITDAQGLGLSHRSSGDDFDAVEHISEWVRAFEAEDYDIEWAQDAEQGQNQEYYGEEDDDHYKDGETYEINDLGDLARVVKEIESDPSQFTEFQPYEDYNSTKRKDNDVDDFGLERWYQMTYEYWPNNIKLSPDGWKELVKSIVEELDHGKEVSLDDLVEVAQNFYIVAAFQNDEEVRGSDWRDTGGRPFDLLAWWTTFYQGLRKWTPMQEEQLPGEWEQYHDPSVPPGITDKTQREQFLDYLNYLFTAGKQTETWTPYHAPGTDEPGLKERHYWQADPREVRKNPITRLPGALTKWKLAMPADQELLDQIHFVMEDTGRREQGQRADELVAYLNNEPVGSVYFVTQEAGGPWAQIRDLSVKPEWQRKGVASALVTELQRRYPQMEHDEDFSYLGQQWIKSYDPQTALQYGFSHWTPTPWR